MATTTTRTLPTPPPVPSFRPASTTKKDPALNPNPHPYAIKTTSTALLTRSNSSGYNVNATHHYYIPTSPSASRSDSFKGHRSSKSLNAVPESPTRESPRPLPIPPSLDGAKSRRDGSGNSGSVSADEVSVPPRRPKRSETLPIITLPSPALTTPALSVDDLPENPKVWTPSQLGTYLTTALRVTSGGKAGEIESIGLPALVAKDIAAFVKGARIGGRTFLRLNEEDLESLGMNKKWRDALLTASRNLRQNVLKGRIWGAESPPATEPSSHRVPSSSQIYSNDVFNSSSSSIESSASMSTGGGEEDGASNTALGRSKARRYRNGRVRGMIETFERSGSFSSDGGFGDGEGSASERTSVRQWLRQEAQLTRQSERVVESPSPSGRRPLPIPPSPSGSSSGPMVADEEPTMEALLAEVATSEPMTGARAWEDMDLEPGITVKRVPSKSDAHTRAEPVIETILGVRTVQGLGNGRSSGGSSRGKGAERRVITAIFAPAPAEVAPDTLKPLESTDGLNSFAENTSIPTPPPDEPPKSRPLPPTPAPAGIEEVHVPEEPDLGVEATHLERLLEEEMIVTRALLDTFRARLEIVEQKVTDLEAREALRSTTEQMQAHATARVYRESVEIGVQSNNTGAVVVADAGIQSDDDDRGAYFNSPVGALTPGSVDSTGKKGNVESREEQPSVIADLPSYVLLVGLGVCAIVTQVVFRKVFGKGVWRP